jgi:hypothetical protein
MWFARDVHGIRGYFVAVSSGGTLRTGIPSGQFTVTAVAPNLTTTTNPTATQTAGKPGLYTFLVPTVFLTTNGVGVYAVVVEVNAVGPVLRDAFTAVVRVTKQDDDSLFNVSQAILGNVV